MSRPKRSRNSDRTRAHILEAARELFVELGYGAVTVRKVAARAGISHGTIYLYFRDKDDLLLQVSEEQFARLLGALRRLPRTRKPAERLIDALQVMAAFGVANPHEFHLMMGTHAAIAERRPRIDRAPMAEQVTGFMTDLVGTVIRKPEAEPEAASLIAWVLVASVTGLVTVAQGDGLSPEQADSALRLQAEILVQGVASAASIETAGTKP